MKHFFERREGSDLERRLRRNRPEPRPEFLAMLSDRIEDRPRRRREASIRIVLVGAVTAVMLVAMSAVGGLAYAASAVQSVAKDVKVVVVAPITAVKTIVNSNSTTGGGGNTGGGSKGDKGGKPDDHEYGHKDHICHKPGKDQQEMDVDHNALAAHLGHGDKIGPCPPKPKPKK
jgi:hypothetical protein